LHRVLDAARNEAHEQPDDQTDKVKSIVCRKALLLYSAVVRLDSLMRLLSASSSQRVLGSVCGTVFVLAGTLKLFAPFGSYLELLRVPFPHLVGIGVSGLEIGGGAILLFGRRLQKFLPHSGRKSALRLICLGLAVDMIVAIVLVGVPGRRGQVHTLNGHAIGLELWRLPLELFLLAAMLWFVWRPSIEDS